jgi:hypothetical protein
MTLNTRVLSYIYASTIDPDYVALETEVVIARYVVIAC